MTEHSWHYPDFSRSIAYNKVDRTRNNANSPGVVFLGGLASDMEAQGKSLLLQRRSLLHRCMGSDRSTRPGRILVSASRRFPIPHLGGCTRITSRGPVSILAVAGHQKPVNPYWGPRHKRRSHRPLPKKDGVAEPACGSAGGTACGSPGVPSHGVAYIRRDTTAD